MQHKIILGLVGKMASGKGTIADYLEREYNAVTFRFSTILRDVLNRLHYEISRNTLQSLSTVLRSEFGEDLLSKVIAEDVKSSVSDIIIVDGVRRMEDIKYLSQLQGFKLARVMASQEKRYNRLINRTENEGDTSKSFEDFVLDEQKEADSEIPMVMEKAQLEIDNNGNFEDLYKSLDKFINGIINKQ